MQLVFVILILWIAIYPVDSAIYLLNNRDQISIRESDCVIHLLSNWGVVNSVFETAPIKILVLGPHPCTRNWVGAMIDPLLLCKLGWREIGHFRVLPGLCFKTRVSAQHLIWKSFFILMQIKLIFTRKVVHLASFWKWGFLELGSGLFLWIKLAWNN